MEQKNLQARIPDDFRYEQNVMKKKNTDNLYRISNDRIPEQVLAYISYEHQYNLLGHGVIDSDVLAEKCGFSAGYLRQRHENPFQLQLSNTTKNPKEGKKKRSFKPEDMKEFVCESRLENAMYILANVPLEGSFIVVEDDQKYVKKFLPYRALDRFTVVREKGRGGKLMIHYQLSNEYRRNLNNFYRKVSLESIKKLRPFGLNPLYFFLITLRDACYAEGRCNTIPDYTPSFERLCNEADIPKTMEARYRKRKLKAALETIKSNSTLNFSVEWIKSTVEGEKYKPIFYFTPELDDEIKDNDATKRLILSTRDRIQNLANEFGHALIEFYLSRKGDLEEMLDDYFFEWIKSDDVQTMRSIAMVMQQAFVDTMNKIPGDIWSRVKKFHEYANTKNKDEFKDWLYDIFNFGERIIPLKISTENKSIDEQ